jgi:hypothetical protein
MPGMSIVDHCHRSDIFRRCTVSRRRHFLPTGDSIKMPFIDHFSIGVADLARSGPFYDALLATIGAARRFEKPDFICYGTGSVEFVVVNAPDDRTQPIASSNGFHVLHRSRPGGGQALSRGRPRPRRERQRCAGIPPAICARPLRGLPDRSRWASRGRGL